MSSDLALKSNLDADEVPENKYNKEIYDEFIFRFSQNGQSLTKVAKDLNRSSAYLSLYKNRKCPGNVGELEKDIAAWLRKNRNTGIPFIDSGFCLTGPSEKMWTVFQVAQLEKVMALLIASSGWGKTTTIEEFCRQNPNTVFISSDIVSRSIGATLDLLGDKLPIARNHLSNNSFLKKIIDDLKDSDRLIIVDEAHFLPWSGFEIFRKIHDCAKVGIVFSGQEATFAEMRGGRKSFLWDQIFSRIAIRCRLTTIDRHDVEVLAGSIYPNFNKECLDFLFLKARGQGKFRVMINVLKRAVRLAESEKIPVDLNLLKEANSLLLL